MKSFAAAIALTFTLVGCASTAETAQDEAWAKCQKLLDKASRSSCVTKALSDANEEKRAREHAETERRTQETQNRELEESVRQAYGLPEKQQGAVLVREPFE